MSKIYVSKPQYVEAVLFNGRNPHEVSALYDTNEIHWKVSFDNMVINGDTLIMPGTYVVKTDGGIMLMNESTFHNNYRRV